MYIWLHDVISAWFSRWSCRNRHLSQCIGLSRSVETRPKLPSWNVIELLLVTMQLFASDWLYLQYHLTIFILIFTCDGRAKIDTCHCALRCRSVETRPKLPSWNVIDILLVTMQLFASDWLYLQYVQYHVTIFILIFTCEFWVYMFFKLDLIIFYTGEV